MQPDITVNVDVKVNAPGEPAPVDTLATVQDVCRRISSGGFLPKQLDPTPSRNFDEAVVNALHKFAEHTGASIGERRELAASILVLAAEIEKLKAAK